MALTSRKLRKVAKKDLKETKYLLKATRKAMLGKTEVVEKVQKSAQEVRQALKAKDDEELTKRLESLEELVQLHLMPHRPNQLWETAKALVIAISIALFIRWLFIEPFRIPSGSMIPTLLVGDQLMVNKLVYGPNVPFSTKKLFMPRAPRRGEVIVFRFPLDPTEDYIKRAVAIPGDVVEIIDRRLYLNGQAVEEIYDGPYDGPTREPNLSFDLYFEQLGDINHELLHMQRNNRFASALENYGPVTVPEDHFFAMGDNRDRSLDSRSWGFVPYSHIKGKALFIHLPLDPDSSPVKYLPRWGRFFKGIR